MNAAPPARLPRGRPAQPVEEQGEQRGSEVEGERGHGRELREDDAPREARPSAVLRALRVLRWMVMHRFYYCNVASPVASLPLNI